MIRPLAPVALLLVAVTSAASPAHAQASKKDDSVVRKALEEELGRAMKGLVIGNEPRPYYVAYTVSDVESASVFATFGAVTSSNRIHNRFVRVDVRVGDANQDNANFAEGFSAGGTLLPLPFEDDDLALRRELWLRTDEAYKRAVQSFSRKRAALQQQAQAEEDKVPDFAPVKPATTVYEADAAKSGLDEAALRAIVGKLSAVLREFPALQDSRASGTHTIERQRFLSSEGSWTDERRSLVRVDVGAETQAEDGMRLRNYAPFAATTVKGLPTADELTKAVRRMAQELSDRRGAKVSEGGSAVVLFEGRAAGQMIHRLLGEQLGGTPPAKTAGGGPRPEGELVSKLGQKVAPPFLDVTDDPLQESGPNGAPLFGAYRADEEGVPAQRVSLVEKGVLKTLLMSRTPRKELGASNGHGRGNPEHGTVRAHYGSLFVTGGKAGLDAAALRARALKLAQEQGTPIYVVRLTEAGEGEGGRSVRPLEVVRIGARGGARGKGKGGGKGNGGAEEPVRGITLEGLLPRTLKELVAVGRTPEVYNTVDRSVPCTVVTPALLFKDVEVRKETGKHPKLPLYPHPFFEKK